ncbi:MAG: hypothetical protein AVDCRST_MAG31-2653, partial [uncultured Sphingomonas sp.]
GGAHRPRGRGRPARGTDARAAGAARLRAGREHARGVRRLLRRRAAQGRRAGARLSQPRRPSARFGPRGRGRDGRSSGTTKV